ncbi:MAG: ATP-binding protein [Treponema sp.]|nr:ATP-binding protein [Treponema sp.]
MITRTILPQLHRLLELYPVVTVTGPRQSGKTTLARNALPDWNYVSLEDPDIRSFCKGDCRGFLATYPERTIIDEAQRVPELFSYLQTHVDAAGRNGMYVLTGSQNMNMMESISQSLAGRTSVLKLLPLSYEEQEDAGILPESVDAQIFTGGYPRIFDSRIPPAQFCKDYIELYVERDVRQLRSIGDLDTFKRFVRLCAGRIGQLLNVQNLADDCGIGATTARSWLSVLETSFIIHFLKPEFRNFSKRLVKTPKLYFCDTAVACSLLEIRDAGQLSSHYLRGSLFENLVVNRFRAGAFNRGEESDLTFWRDKSGVEIDLLSKSAGTDGQPVRAWEIKAGSTYSEDYFKNLRHWSDLSGVPSENCSVIYTGQNPMKTKSGNLVPWSKLNI